MNRKTLESRAQGVENGGILGRVFPLLYSVKVVDDQIIVHYNGNDYRCDEHEDCYEESDV